jgi:hypothetical protein
VRVVRGVVGQYGVAAGNDEPEHVVEIGELEVSALFVFAQRGFVERPVLGLVPDDARVRQDPQRRSVCDDPREPVFAPGLGQRPLHE